MSVDLSRKMQGLDLFSGIGGISLALEPWVRTVAYCENDRYAQAVLLSRMAERKLDVAPIWNDVRTLSPDNLRFITGLQEEENSMAGKLKKLCLEDVEQAVQLYENGMSLADIGHLFGVTRQSVWSLLKKRTTMRSNKKWREENHFYRGGKRADVRAWDTMEHAIRSGKLVNPRVCEGCGSTACFRDGRTAIQGHHDDYNQPLSVRWLCQKCHHEWHKNNLPVVRKGGDEGSQVDIMFGGFP